MARTFAAKFNQLDIPPDMDRPGSRYWCVDREILRLTNFFPYEDSPRLNILESPLGSIVLNHPNYKRYRQVYIYLVVKKLKQWTLLVYSTGISQGINLKITCQYE
ncbi:unnamed protein product [Lupinus luteus]|uniref:Uncharacterized protein n=1 Tax=Lupinus luteus TaxID=3873 RepID=A0AAV1WP50_LUPLU